MTIQIVGGGCARCRQLEENARTALNNLNISAEIVKVSSSDEMMEMGVMVTPALAIDGDIKISGKVLTSGEIEAMLKDNE